MPLKAKPAAEAGPATRLRGDHTVMLYAPRKGAPLSVRVQAVQVGRYTTEVVAHVPGLPDAKRVLRPKGAGGPDSAVVSFRAPTRGIVTLDLSTHANAATVTALPPHAWLVLEASQRRPLHVISRVGRLHFLVPRTTKRFAVFARGGERRENVRVSVFDPEGNLARRVSVPGDQTRAARVDVPEQHRGKVWWLSADRPPELDGVFEDAYLWLSDDVPAHVSPQRDGLVVPFCHGLAQPPRWRGKGAVTLSLALNVEPPENARLVASLVSGRGANMMPVDTRSVRAHETLRLVVSRHMPAGTLRLLVRLVDRAGGHIAAAESSVTLTRDLIFVGEPQPLVRAELVEREDKLPALSLQRNFSGLAVPLNARIRLIRTKIPEPPGDLSGDEVFERTIDSIRDEAQIVSPPDGLGDGHYQWKVVVRTPAGEVVDVQFAHFLLKGGKLFTEVPPAPAPPMPALSKEDEERGFVGFVPKVAEAVPYNHRPREDEPEAAAVIPFYPGHPKDRIKRPLRIVVARAEYEPATLGIWAAKDVRGLRVEVEAPRHERTGAKLPVGVRVARHWPQRVSWSTTTYRIIPEMLEPNHRFDLALGQLRQVWLTVYASPKAPSGRYPGAVTVLDGRGRAWRKALEVRVLPFELQRPEHVHWGLYSDSARWKRYPDSQVRAELQDVVAHGITTLMCYPLYHAKVSYENGQLRIDASEFMKYMRIAREVGLRPPWVMSLQALRGTVLRRLPGTKLTDTEFKKLYQAIASAFARLARENDLGECVWHAIDEPWSKEKLRRAVIGLGYLGELGLPTFTTASIVPPELDEVLDVRCYSIGYLLGSPGVLQMRRRETTASNDRLWYYGSGCYTGQDGNVIANRFITGFLFWRSGAEGEWSWTFLRPKGDAHDDFDGERHREAKDACIVYPSADRGAPTPTLQWEDIREGIDDYSYAYTLQQLAKKKGGPTAEAALRELERLTASIPVRRRPGDFAAARAQELRAQIVRLLETLLE